MSKIIYIFILAVILVPLYAVTPIVSPWDHHGTELTTSPQIVPGSSPIIYPEVYTREREIYGYRPRFMPMKVNFDKNNRPYMFTSVHPTNKYDGNQSATDSFFTTEKFYIQTLDDSGNWVAYDVSGILRELFGYGPYSNPSIAGGVKHKENIVFGDDGKTVYFGLYDAVRGRKTIIYSYDGLDTVKYCDIVATGIGTAVLEGFDTFLSTERYLPTVCNSYRGLTVYVPVTVYGLRKDPMGNIVQNGSAVVSPAEYGDLAPLHSGVMNVTATVGDTVHCVWFDNSKQLMTDHTDQYYSNYNRTTGVVSTPVYLGSTFGNWYDSDPYTVPADTHNGPVITVDRNKTIHVVLGGHHSQAIYRYSTDNGKNWSQSYNLPGGNSVNTYPAVITDRDNTVHLVYRCSINGRRLAYSRKKAGQDWQDMGALVVPHWWGHGQYHHNITVDRLGRLFVTYWYSATSSTGMPADIQAEYDAKWPGQEAQLAHDPVILISDNGGDTWRIATTPDFVNGLIDDTIPVVCCLFDNAGEPGIDMAGYDNNFDVSSGQPVAEDGLAGGAAGFDGIDDAIAAAFPQADAFNDGAFTVAGWFKLASQPLATSNLVYARTDSRGFALSVNNGQWSVYTYADGYSDVTTAPQPAAFGQWTHIAFTYSPSGSPVSGTYTGMAKVYVNGQLAATGTARKYNPNGTNAITIGGGSLGFAVDEFGIFSGAMPAQRIAELAANEFRPSDVSRELLYKGDFNEDGFVDTSDLAMFAGSWLEGN